MLGFRDHLRGDPADRERYAAAKRARAAQRWRHMQDYADAKTEIVETILQRANPVLGPWHGSTRAHLSRTVTSRASGGPLLVAQRWHEPGPPPLSARNSQVAWCRSLRGGP
jgi:hypothetical protein